ncbi:MAG: hypothetical protein WCO57_10450 [Verrucomicrobiota bacterium]
MKYSLLLTFSLALALPLHAACPNKRAANQTKAKPNPQEIFNQKDTNHDGSLSKEEFSAGVKDATKAAENFARKDKDSDGKLSLAEFTGKEEKKK